MNVKDLRIGNYVINENSIFQLRLTDDCELVYHFVGSKDFHFTAKQAKGKMKPIKITPEWLIKLGFTRNHEDGEFDHKDNENVIILCEDDGYTFDYDYGVIEWCQCGVEYVHQLQNHYYLMTGQELTMGVGNEQIHSKLNTSTKCGV